MAAFSEHLSHARVLTLLSRAVPYYLDCWQEVDRATGLFGSTDPQVYNMRSMATSSPVIEYVIRPHLQVLCILAAFVHDREGRELLAPHGGTGETLEKITRGLRWACETHLTGSRDVDAFLGRRRWGENWRSSLWATQLALCTTLVRSRLPGEVVEDVRRVVAFEADRFIDVVPPSGCEVDTKLEENAQDAMVLAWAVNLCHGHEHVAQWQHALRMWAVNIAATVEDRGDHSQYCGQSVAYWLTANTLYTDMTAENHGFFHPEVLMYSQWVVLGMMAYALADRPVPECLHRPHHQETFDVLLRFLLPNGMPCSPGGTDLPQFLPRPFGLAWGLWHDDPGAVRLTERLVAWLEAAAERSTEAGTPWVFGLQPGRDGWNLLFQSQVGLELALLAVTPAKQDGEWFSLAAVRTTAGDTARIYPFIEVCSALNSRATRCVAWKALGSHPSVTVWPHDAPDLVAPGRGSLLGIPETSPPVKRWSVRFHNDRPHRDGFDSSGRISYCGADGQELLMRDVRVVTWGDDGILVMDQITTTQPLELSEQYLSPLYLVNDIWTRNRLQLTSGSLEETLEGGTGLGRPISCPSFWASIDQQLLVQLLWGRTKGLTFIPETERCAPPYWKNCRQNRLALHLDSTPAEAGEKVYQVCFLVGSGKGPRGIKCSGSPGEFFRGLVIMDGKHTLGL